MFGVENQRAAMRSKASGVQRLTTAMNASTATSSPLAWPRARSATAPSEGFVGCAAFQTAHNLARRRDGSSFDREAVVKIGFVEGIS